MTPTNRFSVRKTWTTALKNIKDPKFLNTQKYFRHSNVKRYELALLRPGAYFGRLYIFKIRTDSAVPGSLHLLLKIRTKPAVRGSLNPIFRIRTDSAVPGSLHLLLKIKTKQVVQGSLQPFFNPDQTGGPRTDSSVRGSLHPPLEVFPKSAVRGSIHPL